MDDQNMNPTPAEETTTDAPAASCGGDSAPAAPAAPAGGDAPAASCGGDSAPAA